MATVCPNMKSREWKLLVEQEGEGRKAYEVWVRNNYDYPPHILAQTEEKIKFTNKYDYQVDPRVMAKSKTIEKAISVLNKKVKRLSYLAKKNPTLKEGVDQLSGLIIELKRLETDAAIVEFVKGADRMTNSALKWLDEMESGKKPLKIENLARIEDYSQAFDILKEIEKDAITDKDLKTELEVIDSVLSKRNQIRRRYLTLSKKIFAEMWAPNFGKIEAKYKRDAELKFNKDNVDGDKLKGDEKSEAKEDYIKQYMLDNAFLIKMETEEYIQRMLTRTEDIPYLTSNLINPKDINNPILSFAVEMLDKADYNIMQSLTGETKAINDLYQSYIGYMGKEGEPSKLYAPLLEKDPSGALTGYYVNSTTSKDQLAEIKSGKYKGTPVEALYDHIIKLQEKKDDMVPNGSKLGYKIPTINKGTLERIYSSGVITATKEGFIDQFTIRAEDTQYGNKTNETIEVITDETGKERQTVPIHFRGKIDAKERSYDILTISLLDLQNTLNYSEKTEIGIVLDVLKENIIDADVVQRTISKNLLKIEKDSGNEVVIKGIYSRLYKNLEDIIRHRVHGISIEGDPKVLKKINSFQSYVGYVGLGFNYLAAGANMSQGTMMLWMESFGGKSNSFTSKNAKNAYLKYSKDLHHIVGDMGNNVPESKTNLLVELFDAHSNWNVAEKKFIEDNFLKKIGGPSILHGLNNMTEHHLQSLTMYSIIDNIKVKNASGDFLTKDFTPTKDRNEAIGIDEAFELKDGELILNKSVKSTELTKGITKDDFFKISRYIKRINRDLYGNYSSENKAMAQRTILGHLVFSMRGWLLPGIQKRWRGIAKVGIKSEDLTLEQMSYNTETNKFEEGQYVTTIRFLKQLAIETKGLKMYLIPENWERLTDEEKARVRKTLVEVAMIVVFLNLATALKDAYDDDKEDKGLLVASYYSRRLFSELFTYANPKEGLRTFKTPAIALNSAEDIVELLGQVVDYDEEYVSGKRKGELKITKKLGDVVPVVKQYDRDIEDAYLYLTK